jgi:hypothetical protein
VEATKEKLMELAMQLHRGKIKIRELRVDKIVETESDDGKSVVYKLKAKPIIGEPEMVLSIHDDLKEWSTKKKDEWILILKKQATQEQLND